MIIRSASTSADWRWPAYLYADSPSFFCAQLRSGTSWDGRKMRAGALARCSASSKPAVDTILWQHTLRFPAPREKDACACHVAGAASLGICTVCT